METAVFIFVFVSLKLKKKKDLSLAGQFDSFYIFVLNPIRLVWACVPKTLCRETAFISAVVFISRCM